MGAEEPRSVSRSEEVDMDTPRRLRGEEVKLIWGSKFRPDRLSGLLSSLLLFLTAPLRIGLMHPLPVLDRSRRRGIVIVVVLDLSASIGVETNKKMLSKYPHKLFPVPDIRICPLLL